MSKDPLDDFSPEPLTARENQKARKIIRDQERMDWLWASLRIWGGWMATATAAMYAAKDYILMALRSLVQ